MIKHYWVTTPEVTAYYQEEPPESGSIFRVIAAKNKREAKLIFVQQERASWKKKSMDQDNWLYHVDGNPFVGLKVESAICEHGVCNCDIDDCSIGEPMDPDIGYCGDCYRSSDYKSAIQALASNDPWAWQCAVESLLQMDSGGALG